MQLKKLLQGSVFALVAAACAIAIPSVVKAEEETPEVGSMEAAGLESVEYNPESATLTVSGKEGSPAVEEVPPVMDEDGETVITPGVPAKPATQGTQEILVGFGKYNKTKNEVTVAAWDTYDGSSATVDLSKLSNVKDNYIVLSTPGKDSMVVKIPAAPKKIKAKFDAAKGVLQAGSGDTATAADLTVSKDSVAGTASLYEFRTAYSSGWTDVEKATYDEDEDVVGYELTDLSLYQEEGAKLFVRVKATDTTVGDAGWKQSSEKVKFGKDEPAVYVAGTLPSKEAKVTIAAKAKGPKATADYAKGTVKFPKDCEYRLATSDNIYKPADATKDAFSAPTAPTAIKKLYEDAGLKLTDAEGNIIEGLPLTADIEVRKAAKGTKGASKWGRLTVMLPQANTLDSNITLGDVDEEPTKEETDKVAADSEVKYGGKGVKDSKLKESDSKADVLKVEYAVAAKKPVLKITNNGDKDYEVTVQSKDTTADKIADTVKPTKVAKGKTVTIKNIEDGQKVFVRVAGDKKATEWVGSYAEFGTIDLEKSVKGTKTEGGGESTATPEEIKADLQKIADSFFTGSKNFVRPATTGVSYPLEVTLTDQEITWGAVDKYTVDGTAISGVKISVAVTSQLCDDDGTSEHFEISDNKLVVGSRPHSNDTVTVKVTLEKGGQIVDKDITVTVTAS